MALAVDAATSAENSLQSSLTWAHTCTGSDLVLRVGVTFFNNSDSVISSVTYDGVAMTVVPSSSVNNGSYVAALYSLIAPATGNNDVVVTMSGNAPFELSCGAISFTGAHQTTPNGTAVTATGTSTSPSATVSSAIDQIVMDTVVMVHGGSISVGSGQTSRWNDIGASGFTKYCGSTEPGGASTTMSWSNTTSQVWAITACPVLPVTVVSSGASSNLLLLGAG